MPSVIGQALFTGVSVQLSAYTADLGFGLGNSRGADAGAWLVNGGVLSTVGNIFGTDDAYFQGNLGAHDYLEYRIVGFKLPAVANTEGGLIGRYTSTGGGGVTAKLKRVGVGQVDAVVNGVTVASAAAIANVDNGTGIDLILTMKGDNYELAWEPNGGGTRTVLGSQTVAGLNDASHQYAGLHKHYTTSSGLPVVYSDLLMTQLDVPPTDPVVLHPVTADSPLTAESKITVDWLRSTLFAAGPLVYDADYSADGGGTWTPIFAALADAGMGSDQTYLWDTTLLPAGTQYLVRIRAYDGVNHSNYASGTLFAIVHPWTQDALGGGSWVQA